MLDVPPLSRYLVSSAAVELQRQRDLSFKDFCSRAEACSGLDYQGLPVQRAVYRVAGLADGETLDCGLENSIKLKNETVILRELLGPQFGLDREQIIHLIWAAETFDDLEQRLKALRCLIRFSYDENGRLLGYTQTVESLLPAIASVRDRQYVLSNGDLASDTISRNLGLRAKVFLLDRNRRIENESSSEGLFDRLSRTLTWRGSR